MNGNGSFWHRTGEPGSENPALQTTSEEMQKMSFLGEMEELRLPETEAEWETDKEPETEDVSETIITSIAPLEKPQKERGTIRVNGALLLLIGAALVVVSVFTTFFVARELYFGGYLSNRSNKLAFNEETIDPDKVAKFQDILWFIEENYYLDYDENQLLEGAIKGMLEALGDPYSRYYAPGAMSSYENYITGSYSGVGIRLQKNDVGYLITEVEADSPAGRVGLEEGDQLLKINDTDVLSMSSQEISTLLGEEGSKVNVTILFQNGVTDTISLTVETVKRQTVFVRDQGNGIYQVIVTQFDEDTGEEFQHAINGLLGNSCQGLIVDLRNNGGGYEREASIVADILLPEGVIATSQDRRGKIIKEIRSDDHYVNLPVVMLINQNSASASELVAGAFRDFQQGTLVGIRSYGKALGQISRDYEQDNSGVVLTVARYFTPSGECIHGVGIAPHEVVELPAEYRNTSPLEIPVEQDTQLKRALELFA